MSQIEPNPMWNDEDYKEPEPDVYISFTTRVAIDWAIRRRIDRGEDPTIPREGDTSDQEVFAEIINKRHNN